VRSPQRGETLRQFRTLFGVGSIAGLTDGELLERFHERRGEVAELAFAVLLERHGPMVRRVCRRVLCDINAADDALQATFLVLARKAGSLRDRSSLASWLHGVALRVAARSRRGETRRRKYEQKCATRAAAEIAGEAWDDTALVIHEELARLPDRLRNPTVLCYVEGNSYEEAARQLGCPMLTVKSRLVEARRRLRVRLERRGVAPSAAVLGAALAAESKAATAVLPPALAESLISSAIRFAANPATAAGVVPAQVVALSEGVLEVMMLTKLKLAAAAGVVALVAWGAGVSAQQPNGAAANVAGAGVAHVDADNTTEINASTGQQPDRLEALERKLDRLIQVLEGGAAKPTPSYSADRPGPARNTNDSKPESADPAPTPNPGAKPAAAPNASPSWRADTHSANTPRAWVANDRAAHDSSADRMTKMERRLDRIERRLQELDQRTGERNSSGDPRIPGSKPGDALGDQPAHRRDLPRDNASRIADALGESDAKPAEQLKKR
jgi:RNA polymerase sigma factor (sigma-70 family)